MLGALLLLLAGAAQEPSPAQGPLVASVRIEAPPDDRARLERYLEVRPGQPLSAEEVRHVVELIHATGAYADVQVEAVSTPAGLEVVFRPLPAPLLDGLRVEGEAVLDARELQRISQLRPREPLWPARLERAAASVRQALVERGFHDAAVRARAEGGARSTAIFTIAAGPRLRVRRLSLEGADPRLRGGLLRQARPRRGQWFVRAEAEAAAERMRRSLAGEGRWGARVEVVEERAGGGRDIDLVFQVAAAEVPQVEFQGADLEPALREDVLRVLREGALQADAVEEAVERLEAAFLARGHRQVSVTRVLDTRPGAHRLVFRLQPGPVATVGALRVAAEDAVGLEGELATRVGEPLVDQRLAEDARSLQRALLARGHAQAEVQVEVPEGQGALPVVFRVREGPRLVVGALRVDVPVPLEGGARELRLREGEPYRAADLAFDSNGLLTAVRESGYPQAEVAPEVTVGEGGRVDVLLRVRPGPRIVVDHVVIAGLERTRESVVRRELLLGEGQPLGLQKVLESQRRLSALGIFDRVSVTEMDPETPERRSLLVFMQEAPLTTVAYGVGYAERDRGRASVEVTRRNLFGMDRSLSTFARVSFRGSRLLTTFREPYLLGRRQELFLTAFREEEDRESFDFVRWGGIAQTARALRPGWSLILRYTFQETHSFNIVDADVVGREFTNSTLSGPSTSLVRDTRDDPLDPRDGHFLSADLQLSHQWLGGDGFAKGFVQGALYERLSARTVLAVSGRVGLARTFGLGDSLLLPRPDRFYAGGDYSLRGFRIDAVNPLGGNALLLGGAELRVDAARHLSAAVFTEAGNVFPLVSRVDVADLRYTAGLGLRYKSAFGPLRVDWGFKLDKRAGESPSRLHVTIGHAF